MLQRVNVEVIDGAGGRKMGHGEVSSAAPAPLTVERGLVLAPQVLQRLLPDVAVVVKGAMQSAGRDIKTEQPPELPSNINQDQPSASDQIPPQTHKPKQETLKQPNLESRQRWNMFPCNLCTLRFPSRATLNEHRLNHEPFKSLGIKRTRERREKGQPFTCKFCLQVFATKHCWQLHMKTHIKSKIVSRKKQENIVYFCSNCEKYFSNLFELYIHKKRTACFLKDMERKCHLYSVCSEEFESTFDLNIHLRTHGAPLKTYSVRKPKITSVNANEPHTETELCDGVSARKPKLAVSVNASKAQGDSELKDSSDLNPKPPGLVNATEAHKDIQFEGSHSVRSPKPAGLVNAPKAQKDLGDSYSAQKPKPITANTTLKRVLEYNFHTCNRIAKTQSKIPKLTDTANCPTANNGTTMTKKVTVKEVFRDSLNERMNVKSAKLQSSNVSEVISKEEVELTNVTTTDSSNKNIFPFMYNYREEKEVFRQICYKSVNTEESNNLYNEHEIKEGIVLRPELLEQLGIDLTNEVSGMNSNIVYVLPDTDIKSSLTDETAYDTSLQSELNKRNTVMKAENPEVVFGEKVGEYDNGVQSNAIIKEEPQEVDDKERMMKTELLSLCKHEVEDELVLGPLLQQSQDVAFDVQSEKDTAARSVNEQNVETMIVKKEPVGFTENISEEPKDGGDNVALEAAWKELYAEYEAMELALIKIEKDSEITETVDITTNIEKKQDTVNVNEELDIIEDPKITDVVDVTDIENKKDTINVKEESEIRYQT